MADPHKARVSGKSGADDEAEKAGESLTDPMEDEVLDIERELVFQSTLMSRFPVNWTGENAAAMVRITEAVERVMAEKFADAYALMEDIYLEVRDPVVDENGEPVRDRLGRMQWEKTEMGTYMEDWTALSVRRREEFLLRMTTMLFEWEQTAASLWTESMFGKALWVENFAIQYRSAVRGTVEDRNSRANTEAAAERYFAIYTSALSRHADALVKSMERITLRLKDLMG